MKTLTMVIRRLALWMYWLAGGALASIMFLTVADVILRLFKRPIVGTYELVGFLGAWAIGFAIPQTSLDKGQVLMDFVTGRLPETANKVLLVVTRLLGIGLFITIGYNLWLMGWSLHQNNEVSLTLHLPHFPLAFGLSFACFTECLVLVSELFPAERSDS